jgi:soluble lytic murein transglycosylase-like protein
MQIDDRYHGTWLAQHNNGMDPAINIDYGAQQLAANIARFPNNLEAAIAAYNARHAAHPRPAALSRRSAGRAPHRSPPADSGRVTAAFQRRSRLSR